MKFIYNDLKVDFNVKVIKDMYTFYNRDKDYYIVNLPIIYAPFAEQVNFLTSFLKTLKPNPMKEADDYVKEEVDNLRFTTYRYVLFINPKTKENYCCVSGCSLARKNSKEFMEQFKKDDIVPLEISSEEIDYIKSFL